MLVNNLFSSIFPIRLASLFPVSPSYMHWPPLSIGPISPSPNYEFLSSTQSNLNTDALDAVSLVYTYNYIMHALTYKPLTRKVRSMLTLVDEEFWVICMWSLLDDPLARMIPLPIHPLNFIPGKCFTQEKADALDLNPTNWLWLDEGKLVCWIVHQQKMAFAWELLEPGHMDLKYFPLVKIPTVPHTPWMLHNIPIPPAMWTDTIQIINDRIACRVYKPSTSAYWSWWFCILK